MTESSSQVQAPGSRAIWLFILSACLGCLVVAISFTGARFSDGWASSVYWLGLLLIVTPAWLLMGAASLSRRERLVVALVVCLALYLVKVLHSPTMFTYPDEYAHWRTVMDITRTDHLFQENPLLPISGSYPGLEIATSALVDLTGLPVFAVGLIIIGLAKLLFSSALFLLYEKLSGSAYLAGVAALVYACNPNFTYFDSQFSYESLALPLATCVLLCFAQLLRREGDYLGLLVVFFLTAGSVAITHHITTYAMVAYLAVWLVAAVLMWAIRHRVWRWGWRSPRLIAAAVATVVVLGAAALIWQRFFGKQTLAYLQPGFEATIREPLRILSGQASGRQLFAATAGQSAPQWEQLLSYASVGLLLLVVIAGLVASWRTKAKPAGWLAFGIVAFAYPVTLLMRLTRAGAEAASRSSEFLFIAMGLIAAAFLVYFLGASLRHKRLALCRHVCVAVFGSVLFVGSLIVGWPVWARMPGPFIVAADMRSINQQGIDAALWLKTEFGPGQRLISDRTNRLFMGTYGEGYPVTGYGQRVHTPAIYFADSIGVNEMNMLTSARVQYIIADTRLADALPLAGVYFEQGEPDWGRQTNPMIKERMTKFEKYFNKVMDSGDIAIYATGIK